VTADSSWRQQPGKMMSLKILIVDDASFVRDTIKRTLRETLAHVELQEAPDGRRALGLLRSNKYDIILSDWEMPELSGEQLLKWVRTEYSNPKIPFIMISSRGDRSHILKAIESGVSDYLGKPFTAEELRRKLNKQLKKIGYKGKPQTASSAGVFSSLEVLTGGSIEDRALENGGEGKPLFTLPSDTKTAAQKKTSFQGKARLRFSNASSCDCMVRSLNSECLTAFVVRSKDVPTLFDQAVVDIENTKGEALARLNAYVHSLTALENSPDTKKLKIVVRFVDNDPEKFEMISNATLFS